MGSLDPAVEEGRKGRRAMREAGKKHVAAECRDDMRQLSSISGADSKLGLIMAWAKFSVNACPVLA